VQLAICILCCIIDDTILSHHWPLVQAYKRAALKYHSDKASADDRDEAEKKFKQVNAANSILSDPAKRQRYDAGTHLPIRTDHAKALPMQPRCPVSLANNDGLGLRVYLSATHYLCLSL